MSQKYTKEFKETIVHLHESEKPVSEFVKSTVLLISLFINESSFMVKLKHQILKTFHFMNSNKCVRK